MRVPIGYDVPWRRVYALLEDAARRTPAVDPAQDPRVLQRSLSDFSVECERVVSLKTDAPVPVAMSRLHEQVRDTIESAGVAILLPHFLAQNAMPPARLRERRRERMELRTPGPLHGHQPLRSLYSNTLPSDRITAKFFAGSSISPRATGRGGAQ